MFKSKRRYLASGFLAFVASLMMVLFLSGSAWALPDLSVRGSSLSPKSVVGAGSGLTLTINMYNGGPDDAGASTLEILYGDFMSTTGLTHLKDLAIAPIPGNGTTVVYTTTVTLPGNVAHGDRYIHYVVDSKNDVAESDENDNETYKGIKVTGYSDLQVATMSVVPTTLRPGDGLTVTYRVKNAGIVRSVPKVGTTFPNKVYLSKDATITTSDIQLGSVIGLDPLDAGATSSLVTKPLTIPSASYAAGTWYVGVIADCYDHVDEDTKEDNNTAAKPISLVYAQGHSCTSSTECFSGHCVDGVCCDTACGGGSAFDCQACAVKAGASQDGTCTILGASRVCRAIFGPCDVAESCSGTSTSCPPDSVKVKGSACPGGSCLMGVCIPSASGDAGSGLRDGGPDGFVSTDDAGLGPRDGPLQAPDATLPAPDVHDAGLDGHDAGLDDRDEDAGAHDAGADAHDAATKKDHSLTPPPRWDLSHLDVGPDADGAPDAMDLQVPELGNTILDMKPKHPVPKPKADDDKGGCAYASAGTSPPSLLSFSILLGFALALVRRRRRRRS